MLFILRPQNFLEQNWICILHMTLQFLGGFFGTNVLPLHLQLSNGVILKQDQPPFEDAATSQFSLHRVSSTN